MLVTHPSHPPTHPPSLPPSLPPSRPPALPPSRSPSLPLSPLSRFSPDPRLQSPGLQEGDLYAFLYDDPDRGCQLNEALRWNLPADASIYHPLAQLVEGSVAMSDLGLLLENAADIHLPVSALAFLAQGADYDLSCVERVFLHTYTQCAVDVALCHVMPHTQCADGAYDPTALSSSLWTRIDTPAALGLASLRPSVQIDTPYETAPSGEEVWRDGYASHLSVTVRFEEPPHPQHSNARMQIACTGLNRSQVAGEGVLIWTLQVGRGMRAPRDALRSFGRGNK